MTTTAQATRASLLIDADAYYSAFIEAAEKAEDFMIIIGWDINSQTHLKPASKNQEYILYNFLRKLRARKPRLQIFLLCWDFSFIYTLERELWPIVNPTAWGEGIHFILDRHHPHLSSHHQKLVIVDHSLAFIGGIDFSDDRWDTPAHEVHSLTRVNSRNIAYRSFHDTQMMLEGPFVQVLSRIAQERWQLALTQSDANPPLYPETPENRQNKSLWPESIKADFVNSEFQALLTLPRLGKQKRRREIYRANLDLIRKAQKYIYIENQYLTSRPIIKAIIKRLKEDEGPEIIVVLPKTSFGWLEGRTIAVLQQRLIKKLEKFDLHNRLQIYYPRLKKNENEYLYVHSKIMVIDDLYLKVGSSNINNRSMGFDTECDVMIHARTEAEKSAIKRIRQTLIAEHLGVTLEWVQSYETYFKNLQQLIASQSHHDRSLQTYPMYRFPLLHYLISDQPFFDRHRPVRSLFMGLFEFNFLRYAIRFWNTLRHYFLKFSKK